MAVQIDSERKAVNITWDADQVGADQVDVWAINPETGDVSTRTDLVNDGACVLTYPYEFTGTSRGFVVPAGTEIPDTAESGVIEPSTLDEEEINHDSGDIEV